ncbi:MAG: hypothetical protein WD267_00065 [Balneolales bacterium]
MNNEKVIQLFKQGDFELNKAREELYHPSEDVVVYSVCMFARSALYHYLVCLYILHSIENDDIIDETGTVEQLAEYCKKYNKGLQEVDLSPFQCRKKDVLSDDQFYYCNDIHHVTTCADLAESIKNLVVKKAWGGKQPVF